MAVYDVYWYDMFDENSKKRVGKGFHTSSEAYVSIESWWERNNFTPRYVRVLGDAEKDGKSTIDYGNHYCFYDIIKHEG